MGAMSPLALSGPPKTSALKSAIEGKADNKCSSDRRCAEPGRRGLEFHLRRCDAAALDALPARRWEVRVKEQS
jgi:hypothetical protein